jgi:hypothetical protein
MVGHLSYRSGWREPNCGFLREDLFFADIEDAVDFASLRVKTQARPSNLGHTPYQESSQA